MSTDYVTIYTKSPIEALKPVIDDLPVLDDLPSFNGSVHISWRNTSPLYKSSFNYDKCLDLEFPNTEYAVKFILNFTARSILNETIYE